MEAVCDPEELSLVGAATCAGGHGSQASANAAPSTRRHCDCVCGAHVAVEWARGKGTGRGDSPPVRWKDVGSAEILHAGTSTYTRIMLLCLLRLICEETFDAVILMSAGCASGATGHGSANAETDKHS